MVTNSYRNAKDVYSVLAEVSVLRAVAKALKMSRQGLRKKFVQGQYLTKEETAAVRRVLADLEKTLRVTRAALDRFPKKV